MLGFNGTFCGVAVQFEPLLTCSLHLATPEIPYALVPAQRNLGPRLFFPRQLRRPAVQSCCPGCVALGRPASACWCAWAAWCLESSSAMTAAAATSRFISTASSRILLTPHVVTMTRPLVRTALWDVLAFGR